MQEGNYWGYLLRGVTSTAKSGNPQIVVAFSVAHNSDGRGGWVELPQAQERSLYLSLTDNAWEYTEKKLKALGFNGDFANPDFAEETTTKGVELICKHEPDQQNRPRERWELAKWGDGNQVEQAATDVLRTLNAKWKAKTAPAPSKPAPGTRPAPPPAGRMARPTAQAPAGAATATAEAEGGEDIPI